MPSGAFLTLRAMGVANRREDRVGPMGGAGRGLQAGRRIQTASVACFPSSPARALVVECCCLSCDLPTSRRHAGPYTVQCSSDGFIAAGDFQ